MELVLELIKAVLDLVSAVIGKLPSDWNDEEQVEAWLAGLNKPLAKLVTLLTPDTLEKVRGIVATTTGKKPEEVDWKAIIDWVAQLLATLFPDYATIITIVAEVLKQLIELLTAEVNRNPAFAGTAFAALLTMKLKERAA